MKMKRFLLVLAVCVLLTGFSGFSIVLAADTPSQQKTVSAEDAKKVREEVRKIGSLFGVEAKEEPASAQETKQVQKREPKTLAGAADKALDMLSQAVATISVTMEKVAPEVWKIMVRQQYARAIADLSLPWGLFLVVLCYVAVAKRLWKKEGELNYGRDSWGDQEFRGFLTTSIPFVLGLLFAIWGAIVVKGSILYLINPQYYAIRDLLQMIMKSGGM